MILKTSPNVKLRKITKDDLQIIRDWRNSKGIYKFNTQFTLLNMKEQKKWFKLLSNKNSDRSMFVVVDKTNKPIGVCGLIHINKTNRCADVAIILGEQSLHGKGLGTEILHLLLEYGFRKLKLHRIGAEVFEYNQISMNLFKKLSFEHEVTMRQSLWRNGKWWDIHVLSLIKNDYKKCNCLAF